MAKKKGGLGRDFYSLFDDNLLETEQKEKTSVDIHRVFPRSDQPRRNFDEESLAILADSIRTHGVIQPIAVRQIEGREDEYEIIAGERRWRAAKMAALDQIPVIILTGDDLRMAEVALIENLQRKDLNPVEEAEAFRAMIERFELTQDELAKQTGMSRSAIANSLRLLDLPDETLALLRDGSLTSGHARALLGLNEAEAIPELARRVVARDLSVRETERLVRRRNAEAERAVAESGEADGANDDVQRRVYMKDLETRVMTKLGRRVRIRETVRKRAVELSFVDDEDLENLLKTLAGEEIFE